MARVRTLVAGRWKAETLTPSMAEPGFDGQLNALEAEISEALRVRAPEFGMVLEDAGVLSVRPLRLSSVGYTRLRVEWPHLGVEAWLVDLGGWVGYKVVGTGLPYAPLLTEDEALSRLLPCLRRTDRDVYAN